MKKKKRGRKKKFSFKREYSEAWNYLKGSKKFIYFGIGIFFFFALIGAFVPAPTFVIEQIQKIITELLKETKGLSGIELMKYIFLNNVKASFFSIALGIFFGLFPLGVALFNGYVLGFVSMLSVSSQGVLSLWRLLPHGIFELPAIFISVGLGLRLGVLVFKKKGLKDLRNNLLETLRIFLLIIVPLLIIAAVIEGILMT